MWTIASAVALHLLAAPIWLCATIVGVLAFFSITPLRKHIFSKTVMVVMDKLGIMPVISETEKTAIEAGSVWVDADFFQVIQISKTSTKKNGKDFEGDEKKFIENQVNTVCNMVTDWSVFEDRDLPDEVWDYLKKEKFLGDDRSKEYGGLGFSAKVKLLKSFLC